MKTDQTCLLEFVQLLLNERLLSSEDVRQLFEEDGGLEALTEDDLPITAYEQLGWICGEKLSSVQLSNFLSQFTDEFQRFGAQRYYFVEAVLVRASERVGQADLAKIIDASPPEFRQYLSSRLGGSKI